MLEYVGQCTCGHVEVRLRSALGPSELQPRTDAETCAFCKQHDGVWISDPAGTLFVRGAAPTRVETFATEQVKFHFCADCGTLAYATFENVAVVRVALFEGIRAGAPAAAKTTFEGESVDAAKQRRLAKWTPLVTL
jgi:hypothetical protein